MQRLVGSSLRVIYNTIVNYMIRTRELETYQKIGVDKETYDLLRAEKKKQKKSMMRIIKNLIIKEYGLNL